MSVEKIKYKDLFDFAERLSFSNLTYKQEKGNFILNLLSQIDNERNKTNLKSAYLSKEEISFLENNGFETNGIWNYLKEGIGIDYTSPLYDYQEAYINYISNPLSKREENFKELKYTEQILSSFEDYNCSKYMALARGEADIFKEDFKKDKFSDLAIIKQKAYGRENFYNQINSLYLKLDEEHNPILVDKLKKLEAIVQEKDISTNNAQLYTTCEFVKNKDGKEELLYTVNAPIIEEDKKDFTFKTLDNEAVTFQITEDGIIGAKYIDYNVYYDTLEVEVPKTSGKGMDLKTGKKAADYLKANPNEDYPDPNCIQQIKIEGQKQWVYLLPDMSYPEKNAPNSFTKDYEKINNVIVNNSLKNISKSIEEVSKEKDILKWNIPEKDMAFLHKEQKSLEISR